MGRLATSHRYWSGILRMLTRAPAERFGVSQHTGAIAPGKDADLMILDADPAQDPLNFACVRCTLRQSK
jgi:imidazolonepropionase-like amidohydrolase